MFQFLNGLNESYQRLRLHIIAMKTFPSLDQAYNMVLSEETQRSLLLQSQSFTEGVAMAVKKSKIEITSFHCGMHGHVKA